MEGAELHKPIKFIKGVGEKLSILLAKKDIRTVRDALYFFPRAYEDRRQLSSIKDLKPADHICAVGRIRRAHPVFFSRSRRRAFEVILEDPDHPLSTLKLTWFREPYQKNLLREGHYLFVSGSAQIFRGQLSMTHPEMEVLGKDAEEVSSRGIVPVYSETEGLYQKTLRKILKTCVLGHSAELVDPLPSFIRDRYGWPALPDAIRALHLPSDSVDLQHLQSSKSPERARLIYEECFMFALSLAQRKRRWADAAGLSFPRSEKFWPLFKENLPFQFTPAQKRVLSEILRDMMSPSSMHRLIQGDVGSGKTVIAAAAALIALEAGYQVALMAPTELLVEQHARNFERWFRGLSIPFVSLTGSMKASLRKEALKRIREESPAMVLGTHALFEADVVYRRLGLIIVDEQHRFGVRQRARLVEKGENPDLLVMTATPIPRTLALTVYGDLDVSVIDELPPGRKPITTRVYLDRERPQMIESLRRELSQGRQAYYILPLIDDSESLELKSIESHLPEITKALSEFKIETLHGRLKAEEKARVLESFRKGEIHVLVSTTVVEVGVDVPNATVMVVEHAERFGLSQLHQLRGRVGRGQDQSHCFLMASHLGTPEILRRLKTMEKTQDGFKLAEVDLEMRGPGELLGTRQAGLPVFRMVELPRDLKLLQQAKADAAELIAQDSELKEYPLLKAYLQEQIKASHLN